MLKINLADGTLFGNDAGEDEIPDVLASYFVNQDSFEPFLNRKNRLSIVRSRKGMGKSALISRFGYDLDNDEKHQIVIRVTGSQVMGISMPENYDNIYLKNYWVRVLCARINFEIGKSIGFAFSDQSMAMVENAEIAGFRDKNIVSALISRISSSKIPIEITQPEIKNHESLLQRAMEQEKDREVWLLVDDIDSTYVNNEQQQALVSNFFSAARSIVRDIRKVNLRATIRTDVWTNFTQNEDLDKSEQYIIDLNWTANELETILSKKILSFIERNKLHDSTTENLDYAKDSGKILELIFKRRMQWGSSAVRPFRPIQILSSGRPRWMSQLCRLSGSEASKRKQDLIGIQEINYILKRYTRYRLDDIYKEHNHQFSDLKNLIETFANKKARYSTSELLGEILNNYCNRIGSANIPEIDGSPYSRPVELAHFLFKIGFIAARKSHKNRTELAEFVRHEERPELLTDSRNLDDNHEWEVYPSYRNALGILSTGRAKRQVRRPFDRNRSRANPKPS